MSISFWYDQWLPEGILYDLIGNCNDEWGAIPVNMFWNELTWNRNKLLEVLPARFVNLILEVPFSGSGRDTCIWKDTSHGKFKLSSAWGLIRKVSSHQHIYTHMWHKYFTPTQSIFLWRLFSYKLPMDTKLQARGLVWPPSVNAAHLGSSQAKMIWQHFSQLFGLAVPSTSCVRIMFQFWKLSTPFFFKFHITVLIPCLVFWFIWCARNDSKHRGMVFNSDKIIGQIYMHLQNISKGKQFEFRVWRGFMHLHSLFCVQIAIAPVIKVTTVKWFPPDPGWLKLNSDGALRQCQAGGGGLIRNSEGTVLQAYYLNLDADNSALAELQALDRGTALLSEMEGDRWWIELDANVLVQILTHGYGGNRKLQNIISRIQSRFLQKQVKITHIYREGNRLADFLADLGCQNQQFCCMGPGELPMGLRGLVRLDQLGLPNFRRSGIG